MAKKYKQINVLDAAIERIRLIFTEFDFYFISFSGGKDSGVMTQLVLHVAHEMGKTPVPVMFFDWEAHYKKTHEFVTRIMTRPDVDPTWICLPVTERNGNSNYEPFWRPWHKSKRNIWVREMPSYPFVINEDNLPESWKEWYDPSHHDLYFFIKYGDWFARKLKAPKIANFVGIRTDESYDRYRMLKSQKHRIKYTDHYGKSHDWCYRYKKNEEEIWYTMPIYDWKFEDLWKAVYDLKLDYNRIYDQFHLMGIPPVNMRVCNPYGEQQKRGIDQYHACEPDTWFRVVNRVAGANFGSNYNKTKITKGKIHKPDNLTWEEYLEVLLKSLPDYVSAHYAKIWKTTVAWHNKQKLKLGIEKTIFDNREDLYAFLERHKQVCRINDLVSYQLMCECIIKGDYWCKKLFFSETLREKDRQNHLIEDYHV